MRAPDVTARGMLRVGAGLLLVALAAIGVLAVRIWPHELALGLDAAVRRTRDLGAAGWVAAALAQIVIALCGVLPASAGALMAGVLYGIVPGFLLSALGTLVGAALAFLVTRSLFRPLVARALSRRPRVDRLDEAVARDGWRMVCLLRISPVMPFAVTSYALGLTGLGLRDYLVGTLAALPALLGYVVLGHLAGAGLDTMAANRMRPVHWVLLGVAIAATALLTLRLGRMIARVVRLPDLQDAAPAPRLRGAPGG